MIGFLRCWYLRFNIAALPLILLQSDSLLSEAATGNRFFSSIYLILIGREEMLCNKTRDLSYFFCATTGPNENLGFGIIFWQT